MKSIIIAAIAALLLGGILQSCSDASAVTQQMPAKEKIPGVYNKKLLPILNKVIEASKKPEAEDYYNWGNNCRCNVGLTAQLACNLTEFQLSSKMIEGSWANYVEKRGNNDLFDRGIKNEDPVLSKMYEVGFTDADIIHLENLDDPKITQYTGELTKDDFKDYVRYLKAWVKNGKFQ